LDRKNEIESTDLPRPWLDETITRSAWEKHREYYMSFPNIGSRPEGWWLYERNMDVPEDQGRTLYEMGELEQMLKFWRDAYERAHGIGRDRTTHDYWHCIPPVLIQRWDASDADR
jgi:hypothetical protein